MTGDKSRSQKATAPQLAAIFRMPLQKHIIPAKDKSTVVASVAPASPADKVSCRFPLRYAKMNEIKKKDGTGTYEITLFGQLGKVFQEMKKITFDTTTEDTDYLINGGDYVDERINRTLVANSWTMSEQTDDILRTKGSTGYNVLDIIGFAPNNSISEGFKYKTYQVDSETS